MTKIEEEILILPYKLKTYFVYILASKPNGVLCIGFTSDLAARVFQHKHEEYEGFTKKYFVHRLVYYELFEDPDEGIKREKQLKRWKRQWKIQLLEKYNPEWKDLYDEGKILLLPLK